MPACPHQSCPCYPDKGLTACPNIRLILWLSKRLRVGEASELGCANRVLIFSGYPDKGLMHCFDKGLSLWLSKRDSRGEAPEVACASRGLVLSKHSSASASAAGRPCCKGLTKSAICFCCLSCFYLSFLVFLAAALAVACCSSSTSCLPTASQSASLGCKQTQQS